MKELEMRENNAIVVQAKSVDHALKKAAEQLGVSTDSLGYELILPDRCGLLVVLRWTQS